MNEIIKSNQNKNIKHIKSLHSKKYRDQYNEYIIEGEKLLREALDYKAEIKLAAFVDGYSDNEALIQLKAQCEASAIAAIIIDERIFNEISETQTPQGVMAIVGKTIYNLEEIITRSSMSLLLLDEVRDPGNLGTIIRTADACNLDAVLLSKGCVDLYNGKSIRATMGSIFHLPVLDGIDIENLIITLNHNCVQTICADPYGSITTFELPYSLKNAIIIGNESNGVSDELKAIIANSVRIPMPGKSESLNAGIAAALMMYEITVRKKLFNDGR